MSNRPANDNDMVVLTSAELKRLIREAIEEAGGAAPPSREFLTAEQLAERLGVCTRSIKTMVSRDSLPTHTVGPRLVRFLWSEVEQWLMARGKNLDGHTAAGSKHLRRVRS